MHFSIMCYGFYVARVEPLKLKRNHEVWWLLTLSFNHVVRGLIPTHGNGTHFMASHLSYRRIPVVRGLVTAAGGGYPGYDQEKES